MRTESTQEYVETISESVINGQHKQATTQFKRAKSDSCNIESLLYGIQEKLSQEQFLRFVSRLLEG